MHAAGDFRSLGAASETQLASRQQNSFGCSQVTTLVDLVPRYELTIRTLGPASWRTIDLTRKDRHGRRNGNVDGVEVVALLSQ